MIYTITNLPSFGHLNKIVLPFTYTVLLLVSMVWMELSSHRLQKEPGFAELLDKLEPVRSEGHFRIGASTPGGRSARRWKAWEAKDLMRRMEGNAEVLVNLAVLHGSETFPRKHEIVRKMRKDYIRLRFCTYLLRALLLDIWQVPGITHLLEYAGKSYWSIVRRLDASYCLHEEPRRCAAFRIACDLTL